MNLYSVKITGFYGRKESVIIRFKDNKLIFVGENGLGKSTIMKILCYALTCQFDELREYIFDEITLRINHHSEITIKRQKLFHQKTTQEDEIDHFVYEMIDSHRYSSLRNIPSRVLRKIAQAVFYNDEYLIEDLCVEHPRHVMEIRNCAYAMKHYLRDKGDVGRYIQRERYLKQVDNSYITTLRSEIKNEIGNIVFLYLPTYRRIERDSSIIFADKIKFRDRSVGNYEEYVEFGMSDVDNVFKEKTGDLKKLFDTTNEKIRQEYYLDVLESKYESIVDQRQRVQNLSADEIDKVIATISNEEKYIQKIKESIESLKDAENASDMTIHQQILSHFFLKFVDSIKVFDSQAKFITDFTDVCNKYLINKEIVYNDKIINNERKFSIDVELKDVELIDDNKKQISLSSLSSGEKQVVSLFCKLYLQNQKKKYFVLIDEPELSISVGWQKMFLKDVVDSPTCVGLFAVTHSPFIYKRNGLEDYTYELEDMKEEQ